MWRKPSEIMWINDASYSFPQQTGSENGVGGIGIIDLVSPFTNQVCQLGGGPLTNLTIYYTINKIIIDLFPIANNKIATIRIVICKPRIS